MDRKKMMMVAQAVASASARRGPSLLDGNVVFLSSSDTWNDYAQLSVDQSSRGVDLTDATTYAHNAAHGLDVTGELTVEVLVQMRTGIANNYAILMRAPTNGATATGINVNSGGTLLQVLPAGAPITIPNLGAELRSYLASWSIRPNPATTGPSNAMLTEHRLWDIAADSYLENSGAHAVVGNGEQTSLGASGTTGGLLWAADGHGRVAYCRISNRARTREEIEAVIPLILAGAPA